MVSRVVQFFRRLTPRRSVEGSNDAFVIGQELALAHEAERIRIELGDGRESPLPSDDYDFWNGDLDLLRAEPVALDDRIRSVCASYSRLDTKERAVWRRSVSMEQLYTLINFAKRSAVFAIRHRDGSVAADGLTAVAMIERDRVDFRDVLVSVALLWHAVRRTSGDAGALFESASSLAEPGVAELIKGFVAGSSEQQDLRQSWGFEEVETHRGAGFIGWGFRKYSPSVDLQSAIVEISELVASDAYQPSQIEIATELLDVWCGRRSDALGRVRAAATLHAALRPGKHAKSDAQQFTIFLVEAATGSDAQELVESSRAHKGGHARLALQRDRLFCLVVARSFVVGVDPFETNDSLARFSQGLASVLDRDA